METGRRSFLSSFVVTLAGAQVLIAGRQRGAPPFEVPDASRSGRSPDDVPPPLPPPDPKRQLKENQKTLRRDADHLLELAQDLKDEAYNTEQTGVLSLSLIHKAEEVEKLAHQMKGLVRAN